MFLQLSELEAGYSRKQVLFGVSMVQNEKEIVTVLGHNGAGKSSLLMAIYGLIDISGGSIHFKGVDITRSKPALNVKRKIAFVPDGHQVFGELTVKENMQIIKYCCNANKYEQWRERAFQVFPVLKRRLSQVSHTLSGGEQQMLSMTRGMLMDPELLIFDEPSVGLSPMMVQNIMESIRIINQDAGVAVLLAEQNLKYALAISSRVYVLKLGKVIVEESSTKFRMRKDYIELF